MEQMIMSTDYKWLVSGGPWQKGGHNGENVLLRVTCVDSGFSTEKLSVMIRTQSPLFIFSSALTNAAIVVFFDCKENIMVSSCCP